MPLLHSANHAFIANRTLSAASEDEIRINLGIRQNILIDLSSRSTNKLPIHLIGGIAYLLVGLTMSYVLLRLVLVVIEPHSFISLGNALYFLLLMVGIVAVMFFGISSLRSAYWLAQPSNRRFQRLYTRMVTDGIILKGVVVSTASAYSGTKVSYQFDNPQGKLITADYFTLYSAAAVKNSDEITVLYLNDAINILL
jgi:uncharacterized membrane protein YqjE